MGTGGKAKQCACRKKTDDKRLRLLLTIVNHLLCKGPVLFFAPIPL